ncbi:exosporium glycoprotein BclB-related protein [Lysinibacillus cavernae]|uniref:exosporium glycoprotein BclB-related protein n=1 Tax=Lysinibacillus cavernae TaxID=2666135 RepID=UPI0012D936B4|nr:exosporium glycoprotein BclB-related protein [Lysinibacillus cavernae]
MCLNNSMCGCSGKGHGNGECNALGPFVAIDAACIVPQPPAQLTGGSIIAFSSGIVPVILTSTAGLITTVSLVGFGSSVPGVSLAGINIDLTALGFTEAFTVPRAGTITSIAATFASTIALALTAGTATVRAQIYRAAVGSNTFSPTTAVVDLAPALSLVTLGIGTLASGNANVSVPVTTGERLLMVFSTTTTGLAALVALEGNASAGITIL